MTRLALIMLALTACGDDAATPLPDAPVPPDASTDGPTVGVVSLTVTDSGTPVEGVDVFFQNADSSLVAKVVTGADGVASTTMGAGGFVTALDPHGNRRNGIAFNHLKTFAGVKPGDQLELSAGSGSVPSTFTVQLPTVTSGIADEYELITSCGTESFVNPGSGGTPGGTVTFYNCGGTADMLVVARDQVGDPLEWFYMAGVAVTPGGTVNLTSGTYQAVPDATFGYQNVPGAFAGVTVFNILQSNRGSLYQLITGGELTAGAGTFTAKRPLVPGTISLVMTLLGAEGTPVATHGVMSWAPTAAAASEDLDGVLMPDYTSYPEVTAASITWQATGTTVPDFVISGVSTVRETPLLGWDWQMVSPYTGTSVALPTLPPEIGQFNFLSTDQPSVDELVTGKAPGGYDVLRAKLLASDGPDGLISGTSGRMVFADLNQQNVVRQAPIEAPGRRPGFLRAR